MIRYIRPILRHLRILLVLLIFPSTLVAESIVGGPIVKDTTWTRSNSPYVVKSSVWVYPKITLKIEPGVQVRFTGPDIIFVDGALVALGTAEAPIRFTSGKESPQPGDWSGFIFSAKSEDAVFDAAGLYQSGTVISHAEIAFGGQIKIRASSPYFSDNYIHHLRASSEYEGTISACQSRAVFRNNIIKYNEQSAFLFAKSSAVVEGNLIAFNIAQKTMGGGIRVEPYGCDVYPWEELNEADVPSSNLIRQNFIGYNRAGALGGGIAVSSGYNWIIGNCIEGNVGPKQDWAGAAIGIYSSETTQIVGNRIEGNIGSQAVFYFHDVSAGQLITGNSLINPEARKEITIGASATENGIGITPFSLNASGNFWGISDIAGILKKIEVSNSITEKVTLEPLFEIAPHVPACSLRDLLLTEPMPPEPPAPVEEVPSSDIPMRSVDLYPRVMRRSGGIVVVDTPLNGRADGSIWMTVKHSYERAHKQPQPLNCVATNCSGLLKFSRAPKSAAKLKTTTITVHASKDGKLRGSKKARLRWRGK